MAAVLFAGGGLDSVTNSGATEVTNAGTFDSTYCDSSVRLVLTASAFIQATLNDASGVATTVTSGQTGWLHFDWYQDLITATTTVNVAEILDSSGFAWLAIRPISSGVLGVYYNSNTGASPTWTQVGTFTASSLAATTRYTFDLKLTIGSPHSAELYLNGTSVGSGTFTQASFTNWRAAKMRPANGNNQTFFSQVLATEGISTINAKVSYRKASGAGSNSGWTGASTDISEAILNDTTVLTSATSGQRSTFAYQDVVVPSGYAIKSVNLFSRAKNDGTAPNNIKPVCRSAGTDYSGSNLSGISTGLAPLCVRYDNDPATSAAWTQTGFNAAEFGVESAT